jgi:hypothetical protein
MSGLADDLVAGSGFGKSDQCCAAQVRSEKPVTQLRAVSISTRLMNRTLAPSCRSNSKDFQKH